MVTFAIIGALGLFLLLISMLFDGIFDFADGLISGVGVGVAALIFGASGVLTGTMGLPIAFSYVIAGVLGMLTLVVSNKMTKAVAKTETKDRPSLVGTEGVALSLITPLIGEVRLESGHELSTRLATSDDDIASGTRIVVISDGSSLRVKPVNVTTTTLTKDGAP